MPTSLYVGVRKARGLPAIARTRKTTDWLDHLLFLTCSFVEVVWADERYVTTVIENSLNPEWKNETVSWDIQEESRLQDDPLIFRVISKIGCDN